MGSESQHELVGNYRIGKLIRCGTFSEVREGLHSITGLAVGLKIVRNQSVENEVACWHKLDHPNIVRLFEHVQQADLDVIAMELVSGRDLFGIVEASPHGMAEGEVQSFMLQLCLAVDACHERGIAHRDVKLENLLIDAKGRLKLCDFGLATPIRQDELLRDFCGSTAYSGPEVLQYRPYDGRLSDSWSIGVVLYAMLTGCLPFSTDDSKHYGSAEDQERAVKIRVLEGVFNPPQCSSGVNEILHGLLCPVAGRRSVRETLAHPWLSLFSPPKVIRPDWQPVVQALVQAGLDKDQVDSCLSTGIPNPLFGLVSTLAYKSVRDA